MVARRKHKGPRQVQRASPQEDSIRGIRPFNFFGAKHRLAGRYPVPEYDIIIEPFAGSAGYSCRHWRKRVLLIEIDPVLAGIWRWLIAATAESVMRLPLLGLEDSVDDFDISEEERHLIGMCINQTARPCKRLNKWARHYLSKPNETSFWNKARRKRLAQMVHRYDHWRVIEGSYETAPNIKATWFIDPPYTDTGKLYEYGNEAINYTALAEWCRSRRGQTMVCEAAGANWLPFEPFQHQGSVVSKDGKRRRNLEALWYRH